MLVYVARSVGIMCLEDGCVHFDKEEKKRMLHGPDVERWELMLGPGRPDWDFNLDSDSGEVGASLTE